MRTSFKYFVFCALIFSSQISFAEIDSREVFNEKFNYGGLSCTPQRFLDKSEFGYHEAFKDGILTKQELQVKFKEVLYSAIHIGLQQTSVINPELADHLQRNAYDIKTKFFCDYTSTLSLLGNIGYAVAFAAHDPIRGARINIGVLTLQLISKHSHYGINHELVLKYVKSILFHEFLHINLRPSTNGIARVGHRAAVKFDPLNPHQYDIVNSLTNYAFRFAGNEREVARQLLLDQAVDKGWMKDYERLQITMELKARGNTPILRVKIPAEIFTFDQCLTSMFSRAEDGRFIDVEFFEDELFRDEIPERLESIAYHCYGLPSFDSPYQEFFLQESGMPLPQLTPFEALIDGVTKRFTLKPNKVYK